MLGDEMNSYAGFLPKGHERVGPGHWVTGMTMQRKRRRWGAEAQELGDIKALGATLPRRLTENGFQKVMQISEAETERTLRTGRRALRSQCGAAQNPNPFLIRIYRL